MVKFTDKEIEIINKMFIDGKDDTEISIFLGCKKQAVKTKRLKLGIINVNGVSNAFNKKRLLNIGKKFNKLTIKEVYKDKRGYSFCRCDCECGGKYEGNLHEVKNGGVKSCGCLAVENGKKAILLADNEVSYIHRLKRLRSGRVISCNSSGITGVFYRKDTGRWGARIQIGYKIIKKSSFTSRGEAHQYRKYLEELYFKPVINEYDGNKKQEEQYKELNGEVNEG